jgi:hypothetical protein
VTDVEGFVVEPDVGFGRDTAIGETSVERYIAPVVVMGVDGFLTRCEPGRECAREDSLVLCL